MKGHLLWALGMALLLSFIACKDDDFDEPPIGELPNLTVTHTIQELKNLYTGSPVQITEDIIIKGIVVSNDAQGNIFKELHIQDSTGGILLRLDVVEINTLYEVGQEVFVLMNGLFLTQYRGTPQIAGNANGDRIVQPLALQVVRAGRLVGVTPTTKAVSELGKEDISTLIRLEGFQFSCSAVEGTFAVPDGGTTRSVVISNPCTGNDEITLRMSDYSDFAGLEVPDGSGTITGIYTEFDDTKQFTIRTVEDVQFTEERCGRQCGLAVTIKEVREAYDNGSTTAPEGSIQAVVISDGNSGNFQGRNAYVQDATAGIVIRFDEDHGFALGDSIHVDVSDLPLEPYNGLLQVNNVPVGNATKKGTGTIEPQQVSILDIIQDFGEYESELVVIDMAELQGVTFGGGVTVTDGSGQDMQLFTRNSAAFASQLVPTGEVTLTAIVSKFNNAQLLMRNLSDVEGGSSGGGDPITIDEVRAVYSGSATTAPSGKIKGIVISDRTTMNLNERNLFIQDETAGIVMRFSGDHSFDLGDELEIIVSGMEVSEFRGLRQINNVPLGAATVVGSGTVTPQVVTISTLLSNFDEYESELVSIEMATVSGGSTFGGNLTVSDGTGSIDVFTFNDATFANSTVPSGEVTVTAVASVYDSEQLHLRSAADIQ